MSKFSLWQAIVLALLVGEYSAQAQTSVAPSPKDCVMVASEGDQYEVRAAESRQFNARIRVFEPLLKK